MGPTTLVQLATMDEVINIIVNVCLEQASATSGAALGVEGGGVRCVD